MTQINKPIGVTGVIGAGKSEVAKRLSESLGLPEYPFAKPIKDIVYGGFEAQYEDTRETKELPQVFVGYLQNIFRAIVAYFPTDKHDTVKLAQKLLHLIQQKFADSFQWVKFQEGRVFMIEASYRELFQLVGTEWGRKCISEDVWTSLRPDACIVSDVRGFAGASDKNAEAKSIIADGGVVLRVVNNKAESNDLSNGHASEAGIDDNYILLTIDNNGTLDDLDKEIEEKVVPELLNHFSPKPKVSDAKSKKAPRASQGTTDEKPEAPSNESSDS